MRKNLRIPGLSQQAVLRLKKLQAQVLANRSNPITDDVSYCHHILLTITAASVVSVYGHFESKYKMYNLLVHSGSYRYFRGVQLFFLIT